MKKTLFFLLVIFVAFGCKKDDDTTTDEEQNNPINLTKGGMESGSFGQIIYNDNVVRFSESIKERLTQVNQNSIVLNYSASFDLINIGDVLFSNTTTSAPNGFARKVTAINKSENSITFTTVQATGGDTFKEIDYEESLSLDLENINSLENAQTRQNRNTQSSPSIRIDHNLEDEKIILTLEIDYDNNFETEVDQIKLEGFIEIEHIAEPTFIIKFNPLDIENTVFALNGVTDATLGGRLSWGGKTSENFNSGDFLDPTTSAPLEIDQRVDIVSIPVTGIYTGDLIMQPEVVVFARLQIDIEGKVYVEFSKDYRHAYDIAYFGDNLGDGWSYTVEELLDDDWDFFFGATAEIEYEATPIAFGPIIDFPQFLLQSDNNNPSFIGLLVYPFTYNAEATVSFDTMTNCFVTEFSGKYQYKSTFEAKISTFLREGIDIDLTIDEFPFTNDNEIEIPLFCFENEVLPATNPNPSDEQTGVSLNGQLNFEAGEGTPNDATFRIFFDQNPNPSFVYNLGIGETSLTYNNLEPLSVYYWQVQTLGENNNVLAESPIWSFTTEEAPMTVTDIDGNVYQTVQIGNQIWMAENLKVTRYADGSQIPFISSDIDWANLPNDNVSKAFSWYNDDISNKDLYGGLYNFAAVINGDLSDNNVQGLCPDGWHIPSKAEILELNDFLIGVVGIDFTAGALKQTGNDNWLPPNTNATNEYGFTALGVGYRNANNGDFDNNQIVSLIHTSFSNSSEISQYHSLVYDSGTASDTFAAKGRGASCRCIKN